MINEGIDVNLVYQDMFTPLIAARGQQIDVAKLLVEKGAEVNISTQKGGYAINNAAQTGNTEICEFLLQKGANI